MAPHPSLPPLSHESASWLEAGQSKALDEKRSSPDIHGVSYPTSCKTADDNTAPTERMPSAGRLLLTLLLSFLVTFGLATALSPGVWHRQPYQRWHSAPQKAGGGGKGQDGVSFTSLLEAASPESLHDLLHKYFPERFKHGVWESDLSAVEAVHRADAALAVSIVQMARRADNGTTTTPPPSSTTTEPPDESTTTGPSQTTTGPPTTSPSTSNSPGRDTSRRTSDSSSPSTSSTPASTTNRPNTSSGPTLTTGRPTFTSTPSLKPVTSTFTSTMDNGGVVVVTTTSWVDPDPVQTEPTTTRPSPTLQNAAPARRHFASGALVGVVLGALLLI